MTTSDPSAAGPADPSDGGFSSEHTTTFPQVLQSLGVSLAVSTYQAGKLIFLRARGGQLNTHFRDFASPMGIAYEAGFLALGTRTEIQTLRNFRHLGVQVDAQAPPDAVFLPATCLVSGDIRIHDIAWGRNHELWAVNTRFSCLCTFDGRHNFVPRWRPPFISDLAAEDRCHLNGLAMHEGLPAYVTCHAAADEADGWRKHKADGGCVVDVKTGETVLQGLSMPHSPRLFQGKLWFLESGCGRVCVMDPATREVKTVAELPGFTRGLDFCGPFAFVGLSQVRETAVFSGIPISAPGRERNCGVWVLDTRSQQVVAFLRFSGLVQEIFAVQVLPFSCPDLIADNAVMVGDSFFVP